MNPILSEWNASKTEAAIADMLSCCAAQRWAERVVELRPIADAESFFDAADRVWATMEEPDWMQAFRAHPRIGERKPAHATAQSSTWSQQEQSAANVAQSHTLASLAEGNQHYEKLFGFTYIICATGKSAETMLGILQRRLTSDRATELREAAEQQRQITQIRLRKWLQV